MSSSHPTAPPEPTHRHTGIAIRKLADKSKGTRITQYHPDTGEKFLVNPDKGEPQPWPLLGIMIEGEAPEHCIMPTSFVTTGRREGWLDLEGEHVVHRSGGPPTNPWSVTHTFQQGEFVVLHTMEGDVRYKVTHQPDKYLQDDDPDQARVDWFYLLERVS